MCKSALLFSKKDYSLSEALRFICRDQKVNLTYCLTFPEVIHHVINSSPEVIFYDAESLKFSYEMYNDFVSTKLFFVPKIVLLSNNPENFTFSHKNIIIVDKKCFSEEVVSILSNLEEKTSKALSQEKIELIRAKVTKLLADLGITTKYLGYDYIRELVINIVADKRLLQSFNKKLYPIMAMNCNTQVNNIERNIRNAISVAANRSKNKVLFEEISGHGCLINASPIPSNKQFITWLVDKVS